jgi:Putative lumazine-binding
MAAIDPLVLVGQTVQQYFEGMHFGDTSQLREVFHVDASLMGYYQGEFIRQSREEWCLEVEGLPKPAEHGDPFEMRIVSVDVTGRIATVKAAVLYLNLRFTDYLTLVQFDDRWKIVHKAYHHE